MVKERVLFVCVHNSARSLMAEGFLKALAGERFEADSAGFEPGVVNPFAVRAMAEVGVDVSGKVPKSVADAAARGERFDVVIAVCGEMEEKCPFVPGATRREHWPFDDPSAARGTDEEKLEAARRVRDQIKAKVARWVESREEAK